MVLEEILEGKVFCFDKPYEWTSFDLVKKIKLRLQNHFGIKKLKVGHAGTLDPLATGVMLICTGKATKGIDVLQAGVKEYVATIKLGETTPSFDLETKVDFRYPFEHINEALLLSVLEDFTGEILQVPPVFSAVKINGKRAYEYARKGEDVEIRAKQLVIDSLEILDFSLPILKLKIVCSKGTYIRALARDIGKALNSGGHLIALERTRVGDYTLENAIALKEFEENFH